MPLFGRSKGQQRQTQAATGQSRDASRGRSTPAAKSKAQAKASPAAKAKSAAVPAGSAPQSQAVSDDRIKRVIEEVREDKLKPLGDMLSHEPNADMCSLVDMYLDEVHASMEQLQEHIAQSSDDDAMMGLVQLSSEFHDLQVRAEDWKQRAGHGSSDHDAAHSGTPHPAVSSAAVSTPAGGGHSSHESARPGRAASQMREGDRITVVTPFDAMGEIPVRLFHGQTGVVDEIDADGDACIDFDHLEDMQWVSSEDLGNLSVVHDGQSPPSHARHQEQYPAHAAGHSQEDDDLQRALEASRLEHEQQTGRQGWPPAPPVDTFEWPGPISQAGQSPAAEPPQPERDHGVEHSSTGPIISEQEQHMAEAESTLRATLAGAGREDKDMLNFALQEAKEAGVTSDAIAEGERALQDLEHGEVLEQARQQLQAELDRPERDAAALQDALAKAVAVGLPHVELAPVQDALKGIGEQADKIKALQEASHSRDPNLLRNAVEEARHVGVPESILKKAEKHLLALQFIARYPEVDRSSMFRGWHQCTSAIRKARDKLKEVLHSGAKAEDVDVAVHALEEADGDDGHEVTEAKRVAAARRSAHDQVVCALVTRDPQDLDSAHRALDHAGGPEADYQHLKPALSAADGDNLFIRDLDLVLPGAVKKYLEERGRPPGQTSKKPTADDTAVVARNTGNAAHATPGADSSKHQPQHDPAVLQGVHSSIGDKQARAKEPLPAPVLSRQIPAAKESPPKPSSSSTTRLNRSREEQEINIQSQAREARIQEMKSKVERARQWVNSQDRVHSRQQHQQKQMWMPQSSPTLLGQSLPHSAASYAGPHASHAGFQNHATPASMPNLAAASKMNYSSQHGMQSHPAAFNSGQPVASSQRHYEDPNFWR